MRLGSSTLASWEGMSTSLYSSSDIPVSSALQEGQAEQGWSEGWRGGRRPFSLLPGNPEQQESRRTRWGWTVSVGAVQEERVAPWLGFWEETGAEAPSLLCGSHTRVSVFSVS